MSGEYLRATLKVYTVVGCDWPMIVFLKDLLALFRPVPFAPARL
ncbi:MAG: hypothetical protein ACUVXJ_00585 [Phycisphaerae bacterium]